MLPFVPAKSILMWVNSFFAHHLYLIFQQDYADCVLDDEDRDQVVSFSMVVRNTIGANFDFRWVPEMGFIEVLRTGIE